MRITYEKGDFVKRINWIESCPLEVQEVTTTGLIVKLYDPSTSNINSYGAEFESGKFLLFEDVWPIDTTLRNAVLIVDSTEVQLSELFDKKFARLMLEHELQRKKPSWEDAPDYAQSLGVCQIDGDSAYGEWCWNAGSNPENFTHLEQRVNK